MWTGLNWHHKLQFYSLLAPSISLEQVDLRGCAGYPAVNWA